MTDYVVGDVQGCLDELRALLAQVAFDPARDRLILAGDLVNRGPQSLETLRFVRGLGRAAISVLGNHDLHLLAVAQGGRSGPRDTLDPLLQAEDGPELIDWLARQPLAWRDPARGWLVIHAGLPPQWTVDDTLALAEEASAALRGPGREGFLSRMYGNDPLLWSPALRGQARLRFIVNCLTRLRYVHADGRIDLRHKGPPGRQPEGLLPWFEAPGRKSADTEIIFGHWSTLGQVRWDQARVHGLDTGCVWGGNLSALDLDRGTVIQVSCAAHRQPGAVED
ncbi:MAG TPA: symmetrical bis(5'-nucleosyl)-tetraphosphatase [Nevskiaceae bacterium]|nr:symmetrical bis(5'-nucleosyl)-tetraphosphatase [Nevskiaceae bacterium]